MDTLLDPPKALFLLVEVATLSFVIYLAYMVCQITPLGGYRPSFLGCIQATPTFFAYLAFFLLVFSYFALALVVRVSDIVLADEPDQEA